jgi:hypothetical protein
VIIPSRFTVGWQVSICYVVLLIAYGLGSCLLNRFFPSMHDPKKEDDLTKFI